MKRTTFLLSMILLVSIFSAQVSALDTFDKLGDRVTNFLLKVAAGKIAGMKIIEKFGENPDIDTGGYEYIWDGGGTYVPPTQARLHDVASDNIADVGTILSTGTITTGSATQVIDSVATFVTDGVVAGETFLNDDDVELGTILSVDSETQLTVLLYMPSNGRPGTYMDIGESYRVVTNGSTGASIFYVQGLDTTYIEQDEFVVLNGTTNVPTIGLYIRQYRARVFGIGTTGAIGVVTSTAQVDGTITCQVVDGNNQTLMAIYTVPADKVGYIFEWWGSLSKKVSAYSSVRMRIGTLGGIGYIIQSRSISSAGSSEFDHINKWHFVPGGVDIWMEADSSVNDLGVSGGYDILIVDN